MRGPAEDCQRQGIAFLPLVVESMGGWHATAAGVEAGQLLGQAHCTVRGGSNLPPLGKARHSHPDGKRGNAETLHLAAPGRTRLYLADLTVPGCT